jgi:hypothetical protein
LIAKYLECILLAHQLRGVTMSGVQSAEHAVAKFISWAAIGVVVVAVSTAAVIGFIAIY